MHIFGLRIEKEKTPTHPNKENTIKFIGLNWFKAGFINDWYKYKNVGFIIKGNKTLKQLFPIVLNPRGLIW